MSARRKGSTTAGDSGVFVCADGASWEWRVRLSNRAKHARVTVSADKGLVVVLPTRARLDPAELLEQLRPRVERMLAEVYDDRVAYLASEQSPLPVVIDYPGIGERRQIVYRDQPDTCGRMTCHVADTAFTLVGDTDDRRLCEKALKGLTFNLAKQALPELLEATAAEIGMSYATCRVTNARTRWGSCSGKGVIMLSSRLVFLSSGLVYHVMCHELAHTHHMDHSRAFHALLATLDPHSAEHIEALKHATASIPPWMQ